MALLQSPPIFSLPCSQAMPAYLPSTDRRVQNRWAWCQVNFCWGRGSFQAWGRGERCDACDSSSTLPSSARKSSWHHPQRNFHLSQVGQKALPLRKDYVRHALLSDQEHILFIFESFVEFNAGGMVERLQDLDLIEQQIGLFDVLLSDFLNGAPLRPVLFLPLVNHSICTFTKFLHEACVTLGLIS